MNSKSIKTVLLMARKYSVGEVNNIYENKNILLQ